MFDLQSIIELLISNAIGTAFGIFVSYYFFLKSESTQKILRSQMEKFHPLLNTFEKDFKSILKSLERDLPNLILPTTRPEYFQPDSQKRLPSDDYPTDLTIPHVEWLIFSSNNILENKQYTALLKLRDHGYDLENPSGIFAQDHLNRSLVVRKLGLGYAEVVFTATNSDQDKIFLSFTLRDKSGNNYAQSFDFNINKEIQS